MDSSRQTEIDKFRDLAIAEYQTVVRMVPGTQLAFWAEERLKALLQEVRLVRLFRSQGRIEGQMSVDNGDIFAGSSDGTISAYSPQSEAEDGIRWRFRSDAAFLNGLILKNGVVYAADKRTVYAIDKQDGRKLWSRETGEDITSSLAEENSVIYAAGASGTWYGVTQDKIEALFSTGAASSVKPLVQGQVLFAADGFGTVSAFDLTGRRLIWSFQTGAGIKADLILWQNLVVVFSGDSRIYALDRATGRKVWSFAAGGPFMAGGAVANNVLYCANGPIFYALSPEGRELWRLRLPEDASALSPVNGRNNIFVCGSGSAVFCVSVTDQKIRWRYRLEDGAREPFLAGDSMGYFSSADSGIYHLEFLK